MTRKRVLLGMDADSVATAMNLFSNSEKFDIIVAHDGQEAAQGIMEETPDMAILDITLPKTGGDECCKKVKKAPISPKTLIVLMVSSETSGDIERCLEAGCDAVLVKPLAYERLSGLVTRLLFWESKTTSRFRVRIPVHYGVDPHKLTDNYSFDLTTRGMFIKTEEIMPVGVPLQVVFTLPNSRATTIQCTARVAWLNDPMLRRTSLLPPGMGLEFADLDKSQVDAIREFLYLQEWVLQA